MSTLLQPGSRAAITHQQQKVRRQVEDMDADADYAELSVGTKLCVYEAFLSVTDGVLVRQFVRLLRPEPCTHRALLMACFTQLGLGGSLIWLRGSKLQHLTVSRQRLTTCEGVEGRHGSDRCRVNRGTTARMPRGLEDSDEALSNKAAPLTRYFQTYYISCWSSANAGLTFGLLSYLTLPSFKLPFDMPPRWRLQRDDRSRCLRGSPSPITVDL